MARPEQTEKATPKRREEARKRGQIARSTDLAGAAIFLAGVFILHGTAAAGFSSLSGILQIGLSRIATQQDFTLRSVWMLFVQAAGGMAFVLLLLFAAALIAAVLTNIAQFGFLFTLQPLSPNLNKVNPLAGFGRLFSRQVSVNVAKQLLKLIAVAVILYTSIAGNLRMFYRMAEMSPHRMVLYVNDIVFGIGWKFGALLLLIGVLDHFWERHRLDDNLKMSRQEVKDEFRQSEGSPEAKAAFKRRQRELARRRMMAAVPRAAVVVTNPTHVAVALAWDEVKMDAPVVVAKGADLLAKRIREIAGEHRVPLMENPPLARTLYASVELDQAIPADLYAAVAQVIAFVYKLKRVATA